MESTRRLRVVRCDDRLTLPPDVALCAAIVRLAMRDAQKSQKYGIEAKEFLDSFLDGLPYKFLNMYQSGQIDLVYLCPWERPELQKKGKK